MSWIIYFDLECTILVMMRYLRLTRESVLDLGDILVSTSISFLMRLTVVIGSIYDIRGAPRMF